MELQEQVTILNTINYNDYKLIKSDETIDNGLKYTKQTYERLDDKRIRVNKTIKEVINRNEYNKYKRDLKVIEERKKWSKFGKGLTDPKLDENNEDEVFMLYNPAILIGNKNKTIINKYINDRRTGKHIEDIRFYENSNIYNEALTNYKNYLDLEDEFSLVTIHNIINKYNAKLKYDLENMGKTKNNEDEPTNLFIKNKIGNDTNTSKSKNYTPPHRKKTDYSTSNSSKNGTGQSDSASIKDGGSYLSYKDSNANSKYTKNKPKNIDNTTIKISNLPSEYTRNDIFYLIKSILPSYYRFNIKTITDRRTNKLKDFCFMNLNDLDNSEETLNILVNSKLKLEYNILNFEWGYKRS